MKYTFVSYLEEVLAYHKAAAFVSTTITIYIIIEICEHCHEACTTVGSHNVAFILQTVNLMSGSVTVGSAFQVVLSVMTMMTVEISAMNVTAKVSFMTCSEGVCTVFRTIRVHLSFLDILLYFYRTYML